MYAYPNELGRYGEFGGKFVPETLMQPLKEIEQAFNELKEDPAFSIAKLFRQTDCADIC